MSDTLWNSVGRNPSVISPIGGGWTWFMQVNYDGTPLTPADTFHAGPYWKEWKHKDAQPFKEYPCDDATVLVAGGERKVEINVTTYQRNIEVFKAAVLSANPLSSGPTFWTILRQMSKTKINSLYQYRLYAACQFEPVQEETQMVNETAFHLWVNPIPASVMYSTFTGVTTAASSYFPSGASITVDPATNPYYSYFTAVS